MKIFIIFLNFLLITLILYSLFSCKIVEGLSECERKENAVNKNKALLDSMFSSLNKLELQQKQDAKGIDINKRRIQENNILARSVVSDAVKNKEEQDKDLAKVTFTDDNTNNQDMKGNVGGSGFSSKLKNSQGSARI